MAEFIEFPVFDGVSRDLRPWISWLEDFFVRERFTAEEKMNLAQSLLEGKAESWFYSIQKMMIFYDWEELKDNLLLRFGDFADPDRIRLIAEHDPFFKDLRDEARIQRLKTTSITKKDSNAKRRKTTSIPEKDSIWETEPEALVPTDTIPVTNWIEPRDSILATNSIQEAHSDPVTDAGASGEKDESHEGTTREEESITQNQVPVSTLEHSLQIPNESPNVCENSQDVVGCEHQRSILQVLLVTAMEEFPYQSTHGTGDNGAHQLFDQKHIKGWRFKFKEVVAGFGQKLFDRFQRVDDISKLAVYAVMEPNITKYISSSFRAKFGQLILDDLRSQMRHKWKSKLLLYSGFDGHISENHIHEKKNGLLVFPWNLMLLEIFLFIHLEVKVYLSGASNSWWGWLVFDRGKNHIITGDVITLVLWDNVEVGSKGLAYDGCVIFGMDGTGCGRGKAELLTTGQQMQRTDLFSFCCSCQNHILVAIYTEITMHTELDEKILWLLLFEKDRVMAADLGRQAGLEQITKGVKHALLHTPFQMISSVGTFVLLAQRVFQKLAAQLSKHFEILIKRIQPALYQLNCFIGSLWDNPITCSKFGHTTNMQLIVVCMLYSWGIYIWFTNSWERKFCKDWWFKFKYNTRIGEAFDYGTI